MAFNISVADAILLKKYETLTNEKLWENFMGDNPTISHVDLAKIILLRKGLEAK